MDAGPFRDVWTAVQPDLSSLKSTLAEGDRVFRGASGKMPQAQYAAALGEAIRGLVARYPPTAKPATFRVLDSPMVAWIWIGGLIVFGGGLICLWPAADRARRRATAGYAARVARDLGRA
jgi:cytochrome c-type biogenesis protein CcmF